MCNAHNHPPGCNCGWGQGWYSGSYGSTFINAGYRYMNKQSFLTMEEKEWRQRVNSFLESKEKKLNYLMMSILTNPKIKIILLKK